MFTALRDPKLPSRDGSRVTSTTLVISDDGDNDISQSALTNKLIEQRKEDYRKASRLYEAGRSSTTAPDHVETVSLPASGIDRDSSVSFSTLIAQLSAGHCSGSLKS
ncbi:hypothetical protein I302_108919 [Kwoniella bestiolae CBS 10118]|uniref:Uncharacterized protein n=1 Tax=Kwoniella bestiolae CBS 10118 TaxID=1296100 RepID=A0A1B9FUG6_9TREE|nr:hypothetical protein I302_08059 [Kwoniella bestiolae CBS 10118]OCF22411.1 hypothetical protein I302_08059 [Kwoniella bestiolae CBS 10118]